MKYVLLLLLSMSYEVSTNENTYQYLDSLLAKHETKVTAAVATLYEYSPEKLKAIYCPDVAAKLGPAELDRIFAIHPKEQLKDFTRVEVIRKQFIYENIETFRGGLLAYSMRVYNDKGEFKNGLIQLKAESGCLYTFAILPVTVLSEQQFEIQS